MMLCCRDWSVKRENPSFGGEMTDRSNYPTPIPNPPGRPRTSSSSTLTDRCLGCRRIFESTWQNRTGYCSSSCILAVMAIREGEYVCPRYLGNRIRFQFETRQRPIPEAGRDDSWIAFTNTPEDHTHPVLGIYEGVGQFAGEGETEVDAVLDLISEIEAKS